jgi:CheY-like chemotaxis protein
MVPAAGLQPGTYVVLSVEDNGMGMDEATKARIFDPFFTTKANGRGLGLAAVHGIVRAHHGALAVTSAPGCGTVFEVLIPVAEGYAEQRAAPAHETAEARKTVLVVDPDEVLRRRAAEILSRAGYDAVVAGDTRSAARQLAERSEIVAVIMDAGTAAGDGPGIPELRPGLPVLLSGVPEESDAIPAAQFVPKPFSTGTLLSKIEALTRTAAAAAASADGVPSADLQNPSRNQA